MIRNALVALDRLSVALSFIGVALLTVSIAVSLVDIVGRKTVGFSVLGINDITQLLVLACVCLGMPLTFCREGHVGVEFVTDPLPPRLLAGVKMLVALTCCVFVALLLRFTFAQMVLQIGKSDVSLTLSIPIVWYWLPLIAGLAVSAVACLVHTMRYAVAAARGRDPGGVQGGVAGVD